MNTQNEPDLPLRWGAVKPSEVALFQTEVFKKKDSSGGSVEIAALNPPAVGTVWKTRDSDPNPNAYLTVWNGLVTEHVHYVFFHQRSSYIIPMRDFYARFVPVALPEIGTRLTDRFGKCVVVRCYDYTIGSPVRIIYDVQDECTEFRASALLSDFFEVFTPLENDDA